MKSQIFTNKLFLSILLVMTMLFIWPITSMAMSLQQAKEMGMVGETQSGYLGSVSSAASVEVKSMVADINKKRKVKYQEIARKTGTSITAVEKLAGKKAVSKTPAGRYIQSQSGKWMRK